MVSVKIILDKRSKKRNGTSPLKLRIVHNRQTYHIGLGYSVLPKDWDIEGQRVKSSCKTIGNTTRFNALINKEKQRALDTLTRLDVEGLLHRLSFKDIKQHIAQKHAKFTVLTYGEEVITGLKKAHKHGNARVYDMMLRSVKSFVRDKDFPFEQLSYAWLKRYEGWFLAKGNSLNGLSMNLRTLRALFNRAIKEKRVSADYYPFNEYKIKKEATRKRAIAMKDIIKLKEFAPQTLRQTRAKHYFLISFYMMGASFVDIAYLKLKNIFQERVEYKRRKTGRLHSIALSEPLKELFKFYIERKEKDDYILNIIKSDDPEQQLINIRNELRRYNRSLKEIGQLCEIEAPLTSYVARHSYATIAKYKGVPTAVISEALGHTSEEVTQIYLDSFDKEVMDKYHQMVIE
jgi:integrase